MIVELSGVAYPAVMSVAVTTHMCGVVSALVGLFIGSLLARCHCSCLMSLGGGGISAGPLLELVCSMRMETVYWTQIKKSSALTLPSIFKTESSIRLVLASRIRLSF